MIKDLKVNKDTRIVSKSKFDKVGLGIQNDNEADVLRFSFDQEFLGQATLLTDIKDINNENVGIPMNYNEANKTYDLVLTKEMLTNENITFQLQIVNGSMVWNSRKVTLPIFRSLKVGEGTLPSTIELWLTNANKELYRIIESEKDRESNETFRLNQEKERASAESSRQSNEESRKTAELTRNSNEEIRKTNESERISNEDIRKSNETIRKENEVNREKYIADLKKDVDDGKFDGKDGQDGKDYILTDQDEENIADKVKIKLEPDLDANLKASKDYTDNANIFDIKDVEFNSNNGSFTFTRHDDTKIIIDLPVELITKDGYYDSNTQELVLILMNNQEIRIPVSGLIDDYSTQDSTTIQLSISADNVITASIKGQSISKIHLTQELQNEINGKVGITDFPTSSRAGVLKTTPTMNFIVNDANGYVTSGISSKEEYKTLSNNAFLSKGTNEAIKGDYVKEAVQSDEVKEELHNQGFVKNNDKASTEKLGLVRISEWSGLLTSASGYLYPNYYTLEQYKKGSLNLTLAKGTLDNVLEPINKNIDDNTDKIKRLEYDIFDSGEAEGTSIHIEDSTYAEAIEIGNEGVSNQETTKGNQLFNIKDGTYIGHNNDLSIEFKDGVGKITILNENFESCSVQVDLNDTLLSKGTYTETGNSGLYPYIRIMYDDNIVVPAMSNLDNGIKTFTLENDANINKINLYFRHLSAGQNIVPNEVQPQLVIGEYTSETMPEFEKFTYGASPNPNYHQPIEVMEAGTYNIYTRGNNFIPIKKDAWESGHYAQDGKKRDFPTRMRVKELIPIIPNESYQCLNHQFILRGYDINKNYVQNMGIIPISQTFNTNEDVFYLGVSIDKVYDEYDESILPIIKLEKSKSNSFEFNQSKETFTIPEGEFVAKQDEITIEWNEEDREYHKYLYKNVGRIFLNNRDWNKDDNGFYTQVNEIKRLSNYSDLIKSNAYRTKATHSSSGNGISGYYNSQDKYPNQNWIYIYDADKMNMSELEFKEDIDNDSIIAYFPLAKPYKLDLGIADMPKTFTEITNVFSDHPLQPNLHIKNYRDFKKTIKELQDKVQILENDTIKNTDYASSDKAGVIKTNQYGFNVDKQGYLYAKILTKATTDVSRKETVVSVGTLENILAPIIEKLEQLSPSSSAESEVNNNDLLQE